MGLLKTSVLNGVAVSTRMGAGLVLNKILAVYVGPAGYAVIGQLQNIIAITTTFAAGALNTGVTKYTAELHDQPGQLRSLWQTAGTITVIGALVAGLLISVFLEEISSYFLNGTEHKQALVWLAGCLFFISLNSLLLAILAGLKDVKRYVGASIAGSLIGLGVSAFLVSTYGLQGILTALSLGQAISLTATLALCYKLGWCRVGELVGKIDWAVAKKLSHYLIMAIATASVIPATQILIRGFIQEEYDINYAGYWDAINKISTIYLTFATTTLSLYYLPRIAEIKEREELKKEIWKCFKFIVPVTIVGSSVIVLFRVELVSLLFTAEFVPMTRLMVWQGIGDVFKIASWLFAYVIIGKARTSVFVVTEILFSASLYLFTVICSNQMGEFGLTAAYAINYALYFLVMYWLVMVKS